jgi:hypothetical protein
MLCMGDVVELAAWTAANGGRGKASSAVRSAEPASGAGQAVAPVRPILGAWHPSLGPANGSRRRIHGIGSNLVPGQIARLDRAVTLIDGATSRISSRGGALAPDVETELLALVGEISLGLLDAAADRAERLASGLGGAASSGP